MELNGDNITIKLPTNKIDINSDIICSAIDAATKLCHEAEVIRSVKTPISLLQEIATKLMCQPVYDNISKEGQSHEQVFHFKVTVGDVTAFGKGISKKRAKHIAAISFLNELKTRANNAMNWTLVKSIEHLIWTIKDLNPEDTNDESLQNSIGKLSLNERNNPVGLLSELLQKYSLRPPTFNFQEPTGAPHSKVFKCVAEFKEFSKTGNGQSKKMAKRDAAQQLLTSLNESEDFKVMVSQTVARDINDLHNNGGKERTNKKSLLKNLKLSTKPTITRLLEKSNDSRQNFMNNELNREVFEQLAREENFKYQYYKIVKNIVLLKIVLDSNRTCVGGTGTNEEEAIENATFNALVLIKLLCIR